jgi:hypothetical protein
MGAKWLPSEGMDLFVRRVLRLLAFDPLLVNLRSVANHAALAWYQRTLRQQPQAFPSDPQALRVGEQGAGSPTSTSAAAGRVVVHCPQCNTGLRLPAGRKGVVACPGCQREFEAQT